MTLILLKNSVLRFCNKSLKLVLSDALSWLDRSPGFGLRISQGR